MSNLYSVQFYNYIKDNIENFFIRAHSFYCALEGAEEYLVNRFEDEDMWELLGVNREEIFIDRVAQEEYAEKENKDKEFLDIVCEQCKAVNSYPVGMAEIRCSHCGKEIKIIKDKQEKDTEQ